MANWLPGQKHLQRLEDEINALKRKGGSGTGTTVRSVGDGTTAHTYTGYVPITRLINAHQLNADVTLDTSDVADTTDARYVTDAQLVTIDASLLLIAQHGWMGI